MILRMVKLGSASTQPFSVNNFRAIPMAAVGGALCHVPHPTLGDCRRVAIIKSSSKHCPYW